MYRRDNQRQYEMKATSASECQAWIDNIKMARSVKSIDINKTYLFLVFFLSQILIIWTQPSTADAHTAKNPGGDQMFANIPWGTLFWILLLFHLPVFQKLVGGGTMFGFQ
jgi:hypothetical protein